MKRNILVIFTVLLCITSASCQSSDLEFIDVEENSSVRIGTNEYYYFKDLYKANPVEKAYYYPETKIQLERYKISKYLITDRLFNQFLKETGFKLKVLEKNPYLKKVFDEYKETQKTFGFGSYYECLCFCQWLSEKMNRTFRFPTDAEWEYACMEDSKNLYPFGAPDGKFESVKDEADTRCIFIDYDKVIEDFSSKGVYSIYGIDQYVMDSFGDKTYSDFPKNCKNPLMLSCSNYVNTRSGEWEYNSRNTPDWGLLKTGQTTFNPKHGDCHIAIRLVIDEGTVFNENTDSPFVFYQKVGQNIQTGDDVLILYKSVDDSKYYILYEENNEWNASWVEASDIRMTEKKWYETEKQS